MAKRAVAWKQTASQSPSIAGDRGPRKPGFRSGAQNHGPYFRAGQLIPESGIYEVLHDLDHRAPHESVLVKGDKFPCCDTCDQRIRFRVVRTAPYIFDDEDFVQ